MQGIVAKNKGKGGKRYDNKSRNNTPRKHNKNSGANKSTIDPNLLVKEAVPREESVYVSSTTFDVMPIHDRLKGNLEKKGYSSPTEIQEKSYDPISEDRDILGIAQTGTGKTGAFLIPLVNKLLNARKPFQVLIMVPTRELAVQIEEEFISITKNLKLFSSCFIGGTNINRDLSKLKRRSHVVIGTPGRLLDLSNRGALDFSKFSKLVLDEFDRLLDMGFTRDVLRITSALINRDQTLLFSATLDKEQKNIIKKLLNDPVEIKVSSGEVTGDHIQQSIIRLKEGETKFKKLLEMVRDDEFEKVIIFAETKRWVNSVCGKLRKAGLSVDQIHGDKTQNYRQKALKKFKSGDVDILVATDVAARGLDISEVTHVINFQMPKTMDSYIHRIGRTGRAGKEGKAFTFVD